MKRSKYLYHVTDASNVDSILRGGLTTYAKRRTMAVYLSTKPLSWYQEGMRILKVDIGGLSCIPATTFLPDSDEVLFWGDIPAWKHTKDGYKPRITDVTDKYVGHKMKGADNEH
jgi:hypothetical protein